MQMSATPKVNKFDLCSRSHRRSAEAIAIRLSVAEISHENFIKLMLLGASPFVWKWNEEIPAKLNIYRFLIIAARVQGVCESE